jgi:hypothetical protein
MEKVLTTPWRRRGVFVTVLSTMIVTAAWAQGPAQTAQPAVQPTQPAVPSTQATVPSTKPAVAPPPADLEPGVNTSAIQPSSSDAASPPAAQTPAPTSPSKATSKRAGGDSTGSTPAKDAMLTKESMPAKSSAAVGGATKARAPAGKAHDSLQLDTTQITGNRELPKVLYIVPWKRSDLGDLVGKPVNSLLDEVLTPVDRDVFKRQNRYYDALKPDGAKDAAGAAAEPQKR